MATETPQPAYVGQPANVPGANIFDFIFGNPFQNESDFVPRARRVPKIRDDQPIFTDHANGKLLPLSYEISQTHQLRITNTLRPPTHILPRKTRRPHSSCKPPIPRPRPKRPRDSPPNSIMHRSRSRSSRAHPAPQLSPLCDSVHGHRRSWSHRHTRLPIVDNH